MLCNLIAGGEVGIEVMFPVEGRAELDLRVKGNSCPERQIYTLGIQFLTEPLGYL
jgi:hypothetical protein